MKFIILLLVVTTLVIIIYYKIHSLSIQRFEGSCLIKSKDTSYKESSNNSFTFSSCSNKNLCSLKVYRDGLETIDCSNCKYVVYEILNDE